MKSQIQRSLEAPEISWRSSTRSRIPTRPDGSRNHRNRRQLARTFTNLRTWARRQRQGKASPPTHSCKWTKITRKKSRRRRQRRRASLRRRRPIAQRRPGSRSNHGPRSSSKASRTSRCARKFGRSRAPRIKSEGADSGRGWSGMPTAALLDPTLAKWSMSGCPL